MTAGIPVRAHSGNCLALASAAIFLVPSVVLFCAMHTPAAERQAVQLAPSYSACVLRLASYDGSLVQQQAEHNTPAVAQNIQQQIWPDFGAYNDEYDPLSAFWSDDPLSNFCNILPALLFKYAVAMPLQLAFIASGFLCLWMAGPVVLSKL